MCYFSFKYNNINGTGSSNFIVQSEDPNLVPTTYKAATSSTVAPSSSSTAAFTSSLSQTPNANPVTNPTGSRTSLQSTSNTVGASQASGRSSAGGQTSVAVGCTIGGVAGLALIYLAVYLLRRYRDRRRQNRFKITQDLKEKTGFDSIPVCYSKPELSSDVQPPQEMPLQQDTSYSVSPYEVYGSETHEMPATPRSRA